ncbi:hypothetical protein [Saccharopolyspora sp. ASAGF58]|uniref:hypothetical protein n=1 Tax=Saccharopolyspora sp. ASAGF58 TaxID=2719023 RepID=UPI00143FF9BB|nr:hypothetical protein [Saccharopolyspora sp. ASAGF58]QIZ35956.1 hypothetical protein FDZ84_16215 [Saccharopolyspora sp. ASAGF58]
MPKYASERIAEELVRAQDRYNQAVQQSQELGEKQVVVDLEDELGQLVLTAYGQVVDVRLRADELRNADGRHLAEVVMRRCNRSRLAASRLREPEESKGWL